MEIKEKLARQVIGALIGLARATDGSEHLINPGATAVILEALAMTRPDAAEDGQLQLLLQRIEAEKRKMVPDCFQCACPCGRTSAYDISQWQTLPPEERTMKKSLLTTAQAAAVELRGKPCPAGAEPLFYKALVAVGLEQIRPDALQALLGDIRQFLS